MLAQRSRPQLFSNALPPTVACSALEAVRVLAPRAGARREAARADRDVPRAAARRSASSRSTARPRSSRSSSARPRSRSSSAGGCSTQGVFVTGFGFPVVPEGTARVRVQMSAAIEDGAHRAGACGVRAGRQRPGADLGGGVQGRAASTTSSTSGVQGDADGPGASRARDHRLRRQFVEGRERRRPSDSRARRGPGRRPGRAVRRRSRAGSVRGGGRDGRRAPGSARLRPGGPDRAGPPSPRSPGRWCSPSAPPPAKHSRSTAGSPGARCTTSTPQATTKG